MMLFYRLLFVPVFLLLLPYYIRRHWKRGGLGRGFAQRLGCLGPIPNKKKGATRIWIQAVSVGELNAITPLIESLLLDNSLELVLSATTLTAYRLLKTRFSARVCKICLFPVDFWAFSARAWSTLKPDLMLLTEGDLWPEHIHQANLRQVPVILLNARLSDRSFKRYTAFRWLAKALLSKLSLVCAASQQDFERFLKLGCPKSTVKLCGNLKIGHPKNPLAPAEKTALKASLGLSTYSRDPKREPLVLAGCSTWPGEEALLLNVLAAARQRDIPTALLLIPRHPERRQALINLLRSLPLRWHLRSSGLGAPSGLDVYVADSIGELPLLLQVADLAFIGKSMPPHTGGQNPLEPAALGLPIVYGPHMSNFRSLCQALEAAKAAVPVSDEAMLVTTLLDLLEHADQRQNLSKALKTWYNHQEGVLDAYLNTLSPFLKPKTKS